MKLVENAIFSKFLQFDIDENIPIYEGRFCVYLLNRKYKCSGKVMYKMATEGTIIFKGKILSVKDYDVDITLDYDSAELEIYQYRPVSVTVSYINDLTIEGYINHGHIRSKNAEVDYVDFDVVNFDKYFGKLIKYNDKLFAGRMEFSSGDFEVIVDKRFDFTKELDERLKDKDGHIITHSGRIRRKDKKSFKTNIINHILDDLSISFSFMCGRYVDICLAFGYKNTENVYRLWRETFISPYRFIPNWKDTISNYHNIEKYLTLINNKLTDDYYNEAIRQAIDWYLQSFDGLTLENNLISIQICLETLSYIVLVEQEKMLTDDEFDENLATKNIRMLLDICGIPYGKDDLFLFDSYINDRFDDGIDLLIYYRNKIVHPTRKRNRATITVEDVWNIIQVGTRYVELVILNIIGYRGEYSNRLLDRAYGEVQLVPWNEN
ncbi:hypothetical protein [Intestinibacter sp.]